jgi:molecular chaperone DnaK
MAKDNKMLGNFRLDGIKPAPRAVPRIEVSFDIDANGILSVTARDEQSGKEQKITITASTNLSKDDVSRLVREAESNAGQDAKVREAADLRNEADNLCYSVERQIREGGNKVAETNRHKAEQLIGDIRTSIENRTDFDTDKLKNLMNELRGALVGIQQDVTANANASSTNSNESNGESSDSGSSSSSSSTHDSEDIVDADVT